MEPRPLGLGHRVGKASPEIQAKEGLANSTGTLQSSLGEAHNWGLGQSSNWWRQLSFKIPASLDWGGCVCVAVPTCGFAKAGRMEIGLELHVHT